MCLLLAIDDATGTVMRAEFAGSEGLMPVSAFRVGYALDSGLPSGIYLDRFSTYSMNHADAKDNPDTLTQFRRALMELRVEPVLARSPQDKGRVERVFRTLQDRLVKEMRLHGISSAAEANRFLKGTFLPDFNERFSVPATLPGDAHRKLTAAERGELPYTLCRREDRKVRNDFTLSYRNAWIQLLPTPRLAVRPRETAEVHEMPGGRLEVRIRGKDTLFKVLDGHPPARRVRPVPATTLVPRRTFLNP